jgi:hypothetical protein
MDRTDKKSYLQRWRAVRKETKKDVQECLEKAQQNISNISAYSQDEYHRE